MKSIVVGIKHDIQKQRQQRTKTPRALLLPALYIEQQDWIEICIQLYRSSTQSKFSYDLFIVLFFEKSYYETWLLKENLFKEQNIKLKGSFVNAQLIKSGALNRRPRKIPITLPSPNFIRIPALNRTASKRKHQRNVYTMDSDRASNVGKRD